MYISVAVGKPVPQSTRWLPCYSSREHVRPPIPLLKVVATLECIQPTGSDARSYRGTDTAAQLQDRISCPGEVRDTA